MFMHVILITDHKGEFFHKIFIKKSVKTKKFKNFESGKLLMLP